MIIKGSSASIFVLLLFALCVYICFSRVDTHITNVTAYSVPSPLLVSKEKIRWVGFISKFASLFLSRTEASILYNVVQKWKLIKKWLLCISREFIFFFFSLFIFDFSLKLWKSAQIINDFSLSSDIWNVLKKKVDEENFYVVSRLYHLM